MANSKNTIDYSRLNMSIQSKRVKITEATAQQIWEVFLRSNGLDTRKRDNSKTEKLNRFASSIESASDWVKTRFAITVNYLVTNGLISKDQIKSLKIKRLEDSTSADKKLQLIMNELKDKISPENKQKLEQHTSEYLLNIANESETADELWKKINDLKTENQDLKDELDASEAMNEIVEKTILSRRSTSNTIRMWNAIRKINEDTSLDPVEKACRVLWQANKYVFWWNKRRRKYFGNIKNMNVNKAYFNAVDSIKKSIATAEWKEKVALRYIMKQVNKAYENYIKHTNISEDIRKGNQRVVDSELAKAA